jgi:hypothetical protein
MYHPRMSAFKDTFKKMFDEVDHYIEEQYGHLYPLHPVRPARGETSNPAADGLFNIGADFTTGYGSKYGRGYLIDISMATLEKVPEEVKQEISDAVVAKLDELLPIYFPNRKLEIFSEGSHFKICGDFSLGYS